jgi:hypothetical protein
MKNKLLNNENLKKKLIFLLVFNELKWNKVTLNYQIVVVVVDQGRIVILKRIK